MKRKETTYDRKQGAAQRLNSEVKPQYRQPYERSESGAVNGRGERLAKALGWFSIGLGLAELIVPGRVADLIGVRNDGKTRMVLRVMGLREIASGAGILAQPRSPGWIWSRVGGDALDLTLLGRAFGSDRNSQGRIAGAAAAVLGVTALDIYDGIRLRRNGASAPEGTQPRPAGTAKAPERHGVHVRKSITVKRPPEEVYRFWHDFQNLPRFMSHLESVQVTGEGRSHWKAKAPAGTTVEWDAEVIDDRPNELIAWRSLEGADVDNTGSVRFEPAPGGRGTEIHVELRYDAPGGRVGAAIAKLFGEEPAQQVQDDLRAFKQVMETGEVVRSDGSLRGRLKQRPARPVEGDPEAVE